MPQPSAVIMARISSSEHLVVARRRLKRINRLVVERMEGLNDSIKARLRNLLSRRIGRSPLRPQSSSGRCEALDLPARHGDLRIKRVRGNAQPSTVDLQNVT